MFHCIKGSYFISITLNQIHCIVKSLCNVFTVFWDQWGYLYLAVKFQLTPQSLYPNKIDIPNKLDFCTAFKYVITNGMSTIFFRFRKINGKRFVDRKIIYNKGINTFFSTKHRSRVTAISILENTNMHTYMASIHHREII